MGRKIRIREGGRMKTITMDYEEYKKEMLKEREAGFEIVGGLKESVSNLIRAMDGYSKDEYEKAKREAFSIYRKLSEWNQ